MTLWNDIKNVTISSNAGIRGNADLVNLGILSQVSEIKIYLKSNSEFVQSQTDQQDQETDQMEALEKWTWDIVCWSDGRFQYFRKFQHFNIGLLRKISRFQNIKLQQL